MYEEVVEYISKELYERNLNIPDNCISRMAYNYAEILDSKGISEFEEDSDVLQVVIDNYLRENELDTNFAYNSDFYEDDYSSGVEEAKEYASKRRM